MRDIGVAVFIQRDFKILLGLRGPASKNGAGCWALPGGLLEAHETPTQGAYREIFEETNMLITFDKNDYIFATTPHEFEGKQRLTLWMYADSVHGEPKIMEPTKCLEWRWFSWPEIAKIPGVYDESDRQYHWIPMPMWDKFI